MNNATGKRINYFLSSMFRLFGCLALLIAYIVVKVVVEPSIGWLNILLMCLCIGALLSGLFNLVMCGMTASAYRENKAVQVVCFIFTLLTGGLFGTAMSLSAMIMKETDEEIENERIVKVRK